jgi:hypothetical protein
MWSIYEKDNKKDMFFLLSLEYISNAYDTMMYIIIDPTIHYPLSTIHYKEACGIQIGQYFLDAE